MILYYHTILCCYYDYWLLSQVIYKTIHHFITIRFLYLDDICYDNWHYKISTHKGNIFNNNVTKRNIHFAFVDTLSGLILEDMSAILVIPARSGGEISQRHNVMM